MPLEVPAFFSVIVGRQVNGFHLENGFLNNETSLEVSKLKFTAP